MPPVLGGASQLLPILAVNHMPLSLILLESNWAGHHPVWFKEYVKAALSLGWNVLAICPDPDSIEVPAGCEHRVRRARFKTGKSGVSKLPGHTYRIIYWWHIARHVRSQVKEARAQGWSHFRLFHASMYDDMFRWFPLAEWFLRIPWSGLYMNSASFHIKGRRKAIDRPERLFLNPRCLGAGVLDETIIPTFRQRLGSGKIVTFPDLSDPSLPDEPAAQAIRINEFAKGRKVVGLLGHLIPRKGVLDFLQVAEAMKGQTVCFVLVGDLSEWLYDADTLALLKDAAAGRIPNLLGIYGPIHCQKVYNSVVSACDILYAAYRNFPNSSNTITKAAQMRRPLIVSAGYVMAHRVEEHGLGKVVPEGDIPALIQAIRCLFDEGCTVDRAGAERIVEAHSIDHLPGCFQQIFR